MAGERAHGANRDGRFVDRLGVFRDVPSAKPVDASMAVGVLEKSGLALESYYLFPTPWCPSRAVSDCHFSQLSMSYVACEKNIFLDQCTGGFGLTSLRFVR